MENKNDVAASIEQARQDNMKPFILAGVENLPGFVAKKKHTEKNEAYYTKIILTALENYEEDLYDDEVSPIKGVDCQTLINDVREFRDRLISGKMVLVEDTDLQREYKDWSACKKKTKEPAIETCGQRLEKETELILKAVEEYRTFLFTMSLTGAYDANLVAELGKLCEDLADGDIILSKNKDQELDMEGKDVAAFIAEQESIQGLNLVGDEVGLPVVGSSKNARYSAFWRRLRSMKSRRNRKSIVKVLTETTIEEFEMQLTKHTNDGYKIKYVNINTKADNSGSGVRYYAVVQRS